MTFRERQEALLADLVAEKAQHGERWTYFYDVKIAEMRAAMGESHGSGTGTEQAGNTIVSDVPGSAA